MIAKTLTELFETAGAGPISYNGHQLYSSYRIPVAEGDRITIRFQHYSETPVQGIGLTAERCQLEVSGTTARKIGLWVDTAPEVVTGRVVGARANASLVFFNQWRDEKYGTTLYHLNNAAMEVEGDAAHSFTFRCSDGWGEVDLEDLVFQVALDMK